MKFFLVIFLILTSCTSKRNIISSKNIESKDSISIQTIKTMKANEEEFLEINLEECIQETFQDSSKRVIKRKLHQTSKKGVVSVSNEKYDTTYIEETGTLETQEKPPKTDNENEGLKYVFYILLIILIIYVVYRIK